ncbi:HDOD domain-containing protein [Dechloromonas agitata]|uniref:HDOD domain-containing protein n=1 Tax=Dechloromonas agitata TaxID=73030 RepID=UPI0012FCA8AA|nr:HDOD domain-containing protein [Dechloromonas agitata]
MSTRISSVHIPDLAAHLPVFPKVVLELLDYLREESLSVHHLVLIARNDPIVSAAVLSSANRLRRMHALADSADLFAAASMIGLDKIRQIIITVGLNRFISQARGQAFYEHSLAVGIIAHELALLSKAVSPNEAYVAGILHDVGQLVFYVHDAAKYSDIRQQANLAGELLRLEVEAFGLDHCQAGVLLGSYWQLPKDIMRATGGHHDNGINCDSGLQAIVMLAESLSRAMDLPASPHNRVTSINHSALALLHLDWHSPGMADCFGRSRTRFEFARRMGSGISTNSRKGTQ